MKTVPAVILFIIYTVLIILATSEFFLYQSSLGSDSHFVMYFLTGLTFIMTGLGYVTYRFGMRILTWIMIAVAVLLGSYVAVVHSNEIKVNNRGISEVNQMMYNLQQANDPKKSSKDS